MKLLSSDVKKTHHPGEDYSPDHTTVCLVYNTRIDSDFLSRKIRGGWKIWILGNTCGVSPEDSAVVLYRQNKQRGHAKLVV